MVIDSNIYMGILFDVALCLGIIWGCLWVLLNVKKRLTWPIPFMVWMTVRLYISVVYLIDRIDGIIPSPQFYNVSNVIVQTVAHISLAFFVFSFIYDYIKAKRNGGQK